MGFEKIDKWRRCFVGKSDFVIGEHFKLSSFR